MSLRLYLDDCAYDKLLRDGLRLAPHQHVVVTPLEAGTLNAPDAIHLAYAAQHSLVLVSKNPRDFLALHRVNPGHAGIFLIYQDNRPSDMAPAEIARAISNVEQANVPLAGEVYVLNQWRY